jgi:hypothetical protein
MVPTLSAKGLQKAGSSTPLRSAQKDGAPSDYLGEKEILVFSCAEPAEGLRIVITPSEKRKSRSNARAPGDLTPPDSDRVQELRRDSSDWAPG